MKKIYQWLFLLGFLTAVCPELMATHNRAGGMTYEQVGPLTIRVKIVTNTIWRSNGSVTVPEDTCLTDMNPMDIRLLVCGPGRRNLFYG